MKEHEISLVDLIFEVLSKWRMIIVFMVIGGVLLGGYSYVQSAKTVEIQNNQVVLSDAQTLAQLEKTLTDEQKSNVKAAIGYGDYNKYYGESFLMQIDANNAPTTELIFSVDAGDEQKEKALVTVYEQLLKTGISEWLIENGMDAKEASKVNELIITENDNFSDSVIFLPEKDSLCVVTVMHTDEAKCKDLAQNVKGYILSQKDILQNAYGAYEVVLVSESFAYILNEELLNNQRTALMNLYNGITYIDKLKTAFTASEKQYYDLLKKGVSVQEEETVETPDVQPAVKQSPALNVKFIVLGMVLFAFLYVFVVFVMFILNNKLRVNDDLSELYDMPLLGVVVRQDTKKKIFGFIDSFIIAIRDRNKRKFTEEESKEITAVAIKMAVKKCDKKEVCFIGCDVKKQTEEICNSIKNILEKEEISVSVLDNVLYNAEEMEKLSDVKNVVIIEKTGATMYDEVSKELELLKRYNINVLGGVLVE